MLTAPLAVFLEFQPLCDVLLILTGVVVAPLALGAGERGLLLSHFKPLRIADCGMRNA